MNHLLVVSLGPIQDFISAARKAQDLWFGSWLLSDLARAAAGAIDSVSGVTLVFPESLFANDADGAPPSVANKIVAVVQGEADVVKRTALSGRAAMQTRLEKHAARSFETAKSSRAFMSVEAWKQIRDLMEYFWVSVSYEEPDYAKALVKAEHGIAALKNTKRWSAVGWGSEAPKSSIDGLRESIFQEWLYNPEREDDRERLHLKRSERLCGVGYLKRRGAEPPSDADAAEADRNRPVFHSASHVAAATLRMRSLDDSAVRAAKEAYVRSLQALGVEFSRIEVRPRETHGFGTPRVSAEVSFPDWCGGHSDAPLRAQRLAGDGARGATSAALNDVDNVILFPARLAEIVEDETGRRPDSAQLEPARKRLGDLHRALDVSEDSLPIYYAMLHADGDSMGAYLEAIGRGDGGLARHKAVSKNLVKFANEATRIVVRHGGSPVYTGGDDVLAFAPLPTALACADALRIAFARMVVDGLPDVDAQKPTLSVGVAIAHHLTNLSEVRAQAKAAEALAKKQPNKNALALIVERRSGPRIELVGAWEVSSGDSLHARLDKFAGLLHKKHISRKTAHDVREALVPLQGPNRQASAEVVKSIVRGVLRQKTRGKLDEATRNDLVARLANYASPEGTPKDSPAQNLSRFGDELDVAWQLCKAYRMARGLPEPTDAAAQESGR